ncbi:MAG: hypothetical protein IJ391_07630 [Clostridia bacterium]|nr:hypothetical protein [Clostridia bacterium]
MKIRHITNIDGGQDGAIYGDYLFRLNARGLCCVYDIDGFRPCDEQTKPISAFYLDRADELIPHSNSVVFGNEFYDPNDEFPLLYTNIYNNCANLRFAGDDLMKGVCCVYRIKRSGCDLSSELVQLIQIGFVEDTEYWRSFADRDDVRPYGNFVVDAENSVLYAFTMRDGHNSTRYFAFDLPKLSQGEPDERYHVNRVILNARDIKKYFDCEYHRFIQGACFNKDRIYSLEGFSNDEKNPPALRVTNTVEGRQEIYVSFDKYGLTAEPELIDFRGDLCYYGDAHGKLYIIEF